MQQDRTPRGAESRNNAAPRTRVVRRRGMFPMDLSLGPDVALRYVRKFITHSQEDKLNFNESQLVGWTPVTVEELPEMAPYRQDDGTIVCGGQILCKNSAEAVQEAIQEFEQDALSQAGNENAEYEAKGNGLVETHSSSSVKPSTRVVRRDR